MTIYSELARTVYFIRPVGMKGPVKIGCSSSPERRRDALETWSPFPLEIVARISGSMIDERRFHALFREQHTHREWFRWSPKLQRVIDEIAAGTFSLACLPPPQKLPQKRKRAAWTPERRKLMSYCLRIHHTEKRTRRYLPAPLRAWRTFLDDDAKMKLVDQFLNDPIKHGLTWAQYQQEHLAHLRTINSDWARAQVARIEAETLLETAA